jgi:hypothetical protein
MVLDDKYVDHAPTQGRASRSAARAAEIFGAPNFIYNLVKNLLGLVSLPDFPLTKNTGALKMKS